MAFPVTLNGRTYTLTDFEGTNYVDGLPDAFEDFVTHAGDIYNSTSTTSNSIGTGSKTFTVESNKPYQAGTPLRIADAAAPSTNFLDTVVTSYSGTTLVVNSIGYGGSGTKTSWTVNIGGAKTVDGTLGLSQGGTGATDAAGARTNIDVYSKADADSRFLNVSGEASDVTITGTLDAGTITADGLTVDKTATISTTDYYASSTFSGTLKGAANNTKAALLLNSVSSSGQNAFASIHSEPISDFRASLIGTYSADGSGAGYFSIKQFLPTSSSTLERMRISSDGSCRWTPDGTNPDMTLDASGDLLVGKTDTSLAVAGARILPTGQVYSTASGAAPFAANRLSSDGAILELYKDTGLVGSIKTLNASEFGISSSNDLVLTQNTTTQRNLLFRDSFFGPFGADNGAIDLGRDTSKFRNLYLSGSIEIENGSNNVGVGKTALNSNTGNGNTALGKQAGMANTTADHSTYIGYAAGETTTGEKNTLIGQQAGYLITSGAKNSVIGRYSGNQGGLDIRTSSNNIVLSDGDGNPRVHVNSSGTLMVATTNPDVSFSSTQTGIAMQTGAQVHLSSGGTALILNHPNNITGTLQQFRYNGSIVGTISNTSSSTSYNTSSDYRLKENVVELTGATDRLKQLEPKRFNFIADADTTVDGFLAHEVSSVVPEAITGTHNEVDDDGNPVYQGIDQSKLVPLLVATIKELEARITALENA